QSGFQLELELAGLAVQRDLEGFFRRVVIDGTVDIGALDHPVAALLAEGERDRIAFRGLVAALDAVAGFTETRDVEEEAAGLIRTDLGGNAAGDAQAAGAVAMVFRIRPER